MTLFDFNNLDEPLFPPRPWGVRREASPEPPPWAHQPAPQPWTPKREARTTYARACYDPGCYDDGVDVANAKEVQPDPGSESAGTGGAPASAPQPEPTTKEPPHAGRDPHYRRIRPQDLGPYIGEVARLLFGSPNKELSSADQMRFGAHGSIAVEIGGAKAGTYYNFENKRGGGVIQLLAFEAGVIGTEAAAWLRDNLGIDIESEQRGKRFTDRIEVMYDYRDESGALAYQVVRLKDPKDFRQRAPDGQGGWTWKVKGIRQLPFMLPELLAAPTDATIYIPEGEKDVLAIRARGLEATCNPGGAGKWRSAFAQYFVGRNVAILPDNDEIGRAHAGQVAASLAPFGRSVRIVELPNLAPKGDVSDWFSAGGTHEQLEALVAAIPQYEAQPAAPRPEAKPATRNRGELAGVIERFNLQYAVVNEAGKAVVYEPTLDPVLKRKVLTRITFPDLLKFYQNELITVALPDGGSVTKSAAKWWFDSPDRRQYLGGVVFDPTGHAPANCWNLWSGFSVEPRPGNWSLMCDHIERVICSSDGTHAEYLLNWIAHTFHRPNQPGHVAVVLRGLKGTGKGILFTWLTRAWGQHGLHITNAKHLVGNFNAHLRDAVFLFVDEAFFAGDRQHESVLKGLITEPTLPIEGKYQNVVQVPNMLHVAMASNSDWVVPATHDERRFFVLDVADNRRGDRAYFDAIREQMENGGLAALIHDMLQRDLSKFDVRDVPDSAALTDQKRHSLDTLDRWLMTVLERGFVWRSRFGLPVFAEWHVFVATELLHQSYLQWCDESRVNRPMTREQLGRRLAELYQPGRPRSEAITGEVQSALFGTNDPDKLVMRQNRPHGYLLGSLEEARARFADQRGVAGAWSGQ